MSLHVCTAANIKTKRDIGFYCHYFNSPCYENLHLSGNMSRRALRVRLMWNFVIADKTTFRFIIICHKNVSRMRYYTYQNLLCASPNCRFLLEMICWPNACHGNDSIEQPCTNWPVTNKKNISV